MPGHPRFGDCNLDPFGQATEWHRWAHKSHRLPFILERYYYQQRNESRYAYYELRAKDDHGQPGIERELIGADFRQALAPDADDTLDLDPDNRKLMFNYQPRQGELVRSRGESLQEMRHSHDLRIGSYRVNLHQTGQFDDLTDFSDSEASSDSDCHDFPETISFKRHGRTNKSEPRNLRQLVTANGRRHYPEVIIPGEAFDSFEACGQFVEGHVVLFQQREDPERSIDPERAERSTVLTVYTFHPRW